MIIRTKAELAYAIEILNRSLYFTYDIETTGLNVRKDSIIGFGCCNPFNQKDCFYIITQEYINGELVQVLSKEEVLLVIKLLARKKLITWNGSFDSRVTYHYYGINLIKSIYHDGMLAAHTLDENKFNYGLKTLAKEEFGLDSTEAQEDMLASIKANGGDKKEYYKADSNKMATYGLQDNVLTARFFIKQQKQLAVKGLTKFFYEDEVMPLYSTVTIQMELKGIPVDLDLLNTTKSEMDIDMQNIEKDIQAELAPLLEDFNNWYNNKEYPAVLSGEFLNTLASLIAPADWPKTKAGGYTFSEALFKKLPHLLQTDLWMYKIKTKRMPDMLVKQVQAQMFANSGQLYAFNILSKPHLKRVFFDKLKEKSVSTTDLGSPQVDDDFLELMADKYTWAAKLRTYNKLTKIYSTYVVGTLDKQEDGIFYPNNFQHRTVSGRLGSNIQQLPRPMESGQAEDIVLKYNNRIRKFFIAGPGCKLVDDDYESLEPHVFAHVSGDDGLKDIFKKGHDFYSTIAIATEGLHQYSADKKADNYLGKANKFARQKSKEYCLGIPYGKGSYALGLSLNIPEKEAERLVNGYLNAYPNLKKWMIDSVEFVKKHGYMKTESGRTRNFPELKALLEKYKGIDMTNALEVWKEYNEMPANYAKAKVDARIIKNCFNNSRNVQIQGLGASIVNRACIALAQKLPTIDPSAYICAQIHDEVIVRCDEAKTADVCKVVQDCLENTYKISLELKAVPSVGNNFYEAKG